MHVCLNYEPHHYVQKAYVVNKEQYYKEKFPAEEFFWLNQAINLQGPRFSWDQLIKQSDRAKDIAKILNIKPGTSLSYALTLSWGDNLINSCNEVTVEYVGLIGQNSERDYSYDKKEQCIYT